MEPSAWGRHPWQMKLNHYSFTIHHFPPIPETAHHQPTSLYPSLMFHPLFKISLMKPYSTLYSFSWGFRLLLPTAQTFPSALLSNSSFFPKFFSCLHHLSKWDSTAGFWWILERMILNYEHFVFCKAPSFPPLPDISQYLRPKFQIIQTRL